MFPGGLALQTLFQKAKTRGDSWQPWHVPLLRAKESEKILFTFDIVPKAVKPLNLFLL